MFDRHITDHFLATLNHIKYGAITVATPDGKNHSYQGNCNGAKAQLMIPSPARLRAEAKKAGLCVAEEFVFGQDCALTIRDWLKNFETRALRHGRTDVMQWELRHAA